MGCKRCTFNNTLVGVEVKSEHHVVFFYDSSRGLLDSLCTNATHGEGLFFVPKSKIMKQLFDLVLNGKEQFYLEYSDSSPSFFPKYVINNLENMLSSDCIITIYSGLLRDYAIMNVHA